MAVDLTQRRPARLGHSLVFLVGGVLTGFLAAVLATGVSLPLVALMMVAVAITLPTLLVRDFTLYWLSGYLLFLPFEVSKRITNLNTDAESFINAFGLPHGRWYIPRIQVRCRSREVQRLAAVTPNPAETMP